MVRTYIYVSLILTPGPTQDRLRAGSSSAAAFLLGLVGIPLVDRGSPGSIKYADSTWALIWTSKATGYGWTAGILLK